MERNDESPDGAATDDVGRRTFMDEAGGLLMGCGLAASYGTLAAYGMNYLYPAKPGETAWLYVARVADLDGAAALSYRIPDGAKVTITRASGRTPEEGFLALSSTCPHLGCKVFWEPQNDRFFCPCHNGVFDRNGDPRSGPPADAGQSLLRYPLEVREGLLFIEVPVGGVVSRGSDGVEERLA